MAPGAANWAKEFFAQLGRVDEEIDFRGHGNHQFLELGLLKIGRARSLLEGETVRRHEGFVDRKSLQSRGRVRTDGAMEAFANDSADEVDGRARMLLETQGDREVVRKDGDIALLVEETGQLVGRRACVEDDGIAILDTIEGRSGDGTLFREPRFLLRPCVGFNRACLRTMAPP